MQLNFMSARQLGQLNQILWYFVSFFSFFQACRTQHHLLPFEKLATAENIRVAGDPLQSNLLVRKTGERGVVIFSIYDVVRVLPSICVVQRHVYFLSKSTTVV